MRETITVTYLIECAGDPAKAAAKIASDQSTGTFVALPGETPALKARVAAEVIAFTELEPAAHPAFGAASDAKPLRRAEATIAFPLEAIGTDLSALMTIAIGGPFAIRELSGLRVTGMRLPDAFGRDWPGPQFGVAGTRRLTGVELRPIIGSIVKPALGLRPMETAALVKELVDAGVDFIKDDEKLASPAYSSLEDRVKAIMPIILDHQHKTGKKVMYAFGIAHADPDVMLRHHDIVVKHGGNCAVITLNSIGFGAMAFLRKRAEIAIHAHRAGWDMLTRHPGLGMDFSVWSQFWRLLGVDQFQINGIRVKYWEPDASFLRSFKALTTPLFSAADCPMPVVGSGQWGGQAPDTFAGTGSTDLLYLAGGGVVAHPMGPAAGVKAVRQAWEAAVAGVALERYAASHPELAASIAAFGKDASAA
jgi:3-oxoisoapionate-4-phosphate decarboxylase